MTLHITTAIHCDHKACGAHSVVPIGTTVERHRQLLSMRDWSRSPDVPASHAGPALGGRDFCPKHAKAGVARLTKLET